MRGVHQLPPMVSLPGEEFGASGIICLEIMTKRNNAAPGSCTLPSPTESQRSQLESPMHKHEGINLDYMPDELLTGEAV